MDLLRSLPIGLYLEQPVTWLHHLDPRTKLVWLVSILVTPILANAEWRFFLVVLLVLLTLQARIPRRVWRQQISWLGLLSGLVMLLTMVMPDGLSIFQQPRLPIPPMVSRLQTESPVSAASTPALNAPKIAPAASSSPAPEPVSANGSLFADTFELPAPTSYRYVILKLGPLTVTQLSRERAVRVGTLLFTLIYGTNLFLLVTASEEITLALEVLMRPLRGLRLPVTEVALTVTLALRFIPLVLEEVQNLVRSIQTRAINWKKLGFRGSAQVWLMVIERLLENLLLRAEQIAAAMQVRGFTTPNEHRVLWQRLVLRRWDWIALGGLAAFWWVRLVFGGEG